MTPYTTSTILTQLIVSNRSNPTINAALLDALFAIRRITWTPR